MKRGKLFLMFVLLVGALIFVSAAYTRSNPQLTRGGTFSSFERDMADLSFDQSMCQEGQDFIVQIAPFGCEPAVVRSDLLEEQDVPVFCKLQAVKINPFIDITAIKSININIRGRYPEGVKSVGFTPSYSALGKNRKLNNLQWDEIGYATIVLRQNPNESSMPDFVTGNLSATIKYDLENAFGLRKHTFYLPLMEDSDFDRNLGQYAFFNKMGYLRAEDVTKDSASIVIYSGRYESPFGKSREGEIERQRIWGDRLSVGQTTGKIYLPGFDCFSAVQFRLEDIEFQDTRVRLNINSQIFEVKEDERFLDNKCYIRDIENMGLNQIVKVTCQEDEGSETFDLRISPKIKLEINGVEGEYAVGDYLFETDESKYAYLGFIGSQSYEAKDLVAYVVIADAKMAKLGESEILAAGKLGEMNPNKKDLLELKRHVIGLSTNFYKWLIDGNSFQRLEYSSKTIEIGGKQVKITGFGSEDDYPITSEIENYYNKALDDYDYIFSNYQGEIYPEDQKISLGEKSIYAKMLLAKDTSQKKDLKFFCDEFKSNFPDSTLDIDFCKNLVLLSNQGVSTRELLIDSNVKKVSFEGIYQPDFEDYGVVLYVKNQSGKIEPHNLRKEQILYLDEKGNEYVQLVSIVDENTVILNIQVDDKAFLQKAGDLYSQDRRFKKDISATFGNYTFTVHNIYFERVAKVSVEPSINYAGSEIDFNFAVGIEKRGIQLSPEMTKKVIDKLNDTIKTWESISSTLETTTDFLEDACLAVGGVLTLKNLLFNSGGESIARQDVMSGTGGWYERCVDMIAVGTYKTEEECLQKNSDKIDNEVNLLAEMLKSQNEEVKTIQSSEEVSQSQGLFGTNVVNTTKLVEEYLPIVKASLNKRGEFIVNPNKINEKISVSSLENLLTPDGWNNNLFSFDLLKKIELYANILNKGGLDSVQTKSYESKLFVAVNQLDLNSENYVKLNDWASSVGTTSANIDFIKIGEKVQELPYEGLIVGDLNLNIIGDGITKSSPVKLLQGSDGRKYILILEKSGIDQMPILRDESYGYYIYDGNGNRIPTKDIPPEIRNVYCKIYDSSSYQNPYKNPKVTYYETDPYKGLPSVVPFDTKNGWFAYVEQNVDFIGEIRSYDKSARVNSFWLCNVGSNGLQEYNGRNKGDDICQLINLGTGQPYNQFSGLEKNEAARKINQAVNAIESASRLYKDGVRTVKIGDQTMTVGSPAISNSLTKCEDYMSPKDCKLLFNVCDPVICPSSRCDFGGQYPVQDVIQSGIIGSLLLCLPNYNEGIYVPVCLTGVESGINNYLSIMRSYQSCLQESLDTGATVGICDQINSIYLCEFFWRQALPLAQLTLPKIIGAITKENTRGGGEYSNFDTVWDNTKNSINFLTEFYAADSFSAFKARSQEEIGSEVCQSFISVSYPEGQGIFDNMLIANDPPQYSGNFEVIPFTSATVPPISQYSVSFRIYAGEDQGAYYKVYLRGGSGSSYYQDTFSGRIVASGYVSVGESVIGKKDFTAPEGYQELCIAVNNEEECGFKQVSTSFASDYIRDQSRQSQIEATNIKSQDECVSGSANIYGLLNLNVQEGIGNTINPEIYNQGITRICATNNPGIGSDPFVGSEDQRWIDVGYCGDTNIRCWIDSTSIDRALEFQISENESLEVLGERFKENLENANGYLNPEQFAKEIENIFNEKNREKKFEMIEGLFGRVYLNNHKGYLYYLRAGIYDELVRELFVELQKKIEKEEAQKKEILSDEEYEKLTGEEKAQFRSATIEDIVINSDFISTIFEFEDGRLSKNLCYLFFEGEWHWSNICVESEAYTYNSPLLGKMEISEIKLEWKKVSLIKENEVNNLNYNFIVSLKNKNYLNGLNIFLKRVVEDNGNWFSDPVLVAKGVGEVDHGRVFQVYDQTIEENLKFKFDDLKKSWFWGYPGTLKEDRAWVGVPDLKHPILQGVELNENEKKIVLMLEGQNKEMGSAIILGGKVIWNVIGQKIIIDKPVSSLEGIPSGEVCEAPEPTPAVVEALNNPRDKVLKMTEELIGKPAYIGDMACFSSVMYIYEQAGVAHSCVYSDSEGRGYAIGDGITTIGIDKKLVKGVWVIIYQMATYPTRDCSLNKASGTNLEMSDKLAEIQPGDILSYVYDKDDGHNVIFIEWIDSINAKAKVFDWNGLVINGKKTYRYTEVSLQDIDHPVYMYWQPIILGQATQTQLEAEVKVSTLELKESSQSAVQDTNALKKEIVLSDTTLTQYNLNSAIQLAGTLKGDYSTSQQNKDFIDALLNQGIINRAEFYEYSDKWNVYSKNKQMSELKTLLLLIKQGSSERASYTNIERDHFSSAERKVFLEGVDCTDCGDDENWYTLGLGNTCDEEECFVLGMSKNKNCFYSSGSCTEK